MTDRDVLTEARELLAGITPGPWYAEERAAEYFDLTVVYNVFHNGDTLDRDLVANVAYDNAEFIAAAPGLVSRLADEVERLRADLDGAAYRAGRRQGAIGRE